MCIQMKEGEWKKWYDWLMNEKGDCGVEAACSPLYPSFHTWTLFVYVFLSHYTLLFSISLLCAQYIQNVGLLHCGLWIDFASKTIEISLSNRDFLWISLQAFLLHQNFAQFFFYRRWKTFYYLASLFFTVYVAEYKPRVYIVLIF